MDAIDRKALQRLSLPDFAGGINSAQPVTDIADNEAADILNLEYDDSNNLTTRNGVIRAPDANVARWDSALWDTDVWNVANSESTSRWTSAYYFKNDAGHDAVLFTTGTKLYDMTLDGLTITDITGSLVLPNDNFWQWVSFVSSVSANGIAIGVNKATGGDNPIKVSGTYPGTAAALGGTAPNARYIEVWNNRVWLVGADVGATNTLYGSKLGDAENWTDATAGSGIATFDINKNDGDEITFIKVFKGRLIVGKKKSIYELVSNPSDTYPSTNDPRNYSVNLLIRNVGCISPYSVQQVLDDIVFLSEGGIVSLSAALITGDFKSSLLSRKIRDLSTLNRSTMDIPSFVLEDMSQYIISIPSVALVTGISQTAFVMDYKNISDQQVRWVRFDQLAAGTAYTSFIDNSGNRVYVIGCSESGNFFPGFYIPKSIAKTFYDGRSAYTKSVLTKAYGFGSNLIRKLFKYWALSVELISTTVQLSLSYYFNTNTNSAGDQSFNLMSTSTGSMYDVSLYDVDVYDATSQSEQTIRRQFLRNSSGRKAKNVQFRLSNAQFNQGLTLKQFDIGYFVLSEKQNEDI